MFLALSPLGGHRKNSTRNVWLGTKPDLNQSLPLKNKVYVLEVMYRCKTAEDTKVILQYRYLSTYGVNALKLSGHKDFEN